MIKNSDMAEKEHDWWREESITAYPKEEDPISQNTKKTLSLKDPKENPFNEDPREDPYCCET